MELYNSLLLGWTTAIATFDAVTSRIGQALGGLSNAAAQAARIPGYVIDLLRSLGEESPATSSNLASRASSAANTQLIFKSTDIPVLKKEIGARLYLTSLTLQASLSDEQLIELLDTCSELTTLTSLTLACNYYTDNAIVKIAEKCPNLTSLTLKSPSREGRNFFITVDGINKLSNLKSLDVSGCILKDDYLELPELTSLVTSGGSEEDHFDGGTLAVRCPKLTSLVLHGNWDLGPNGLADFDSLPLENIDISDCQFQEITTPPMCTTNLTAVSREAAAQTAELAALVEFAEKHPDLIVEGRDKIGMRVQNFAHADWGLHTSQYAR